ncbi:hypothetical protein D3C80_1771160 [compost metagenome]
MAFQAVADRGSGTRTKSTDEAQRVDAAELQTAQQTLRSGIVSAATQNCMRQHSD